MNRRGILATILAAGMAPAIVRAEWLMKGRGIIVPRTDLIVPKSIYIDGSANGLGTGLSWHNAFNSLDDAFKALGDRINAETVYFRSSAGAEGRTVEFHFCDLRLSEDQ